MAARNRMAILNDVVNAHASIAEARENYRRTLREALTAGLTQTEIAAELGVTRATVANDARPEEERHARQRNNTARQARIRAHAKAYEKQKKGSDPAVQTGSEPSHRT